MTDAPVPTDAGSTNAGPPRETIAGVVGVAFGCLLVLWGLLAPLGWAFARADRALTAPHLPQALRLAWRATVATFLVVLGALTFEQGRIYRDEETLWRDTVAKNPESWLAHNNLGGIYGRRDEPELASHHFRRVVELVPPVQQQLGPHRRLAVLVRRLHQSAPLVVPPARERAVRPHRGGAEGGA